MNEFEGNGDQLPHLVRVSIDLDARGESRSCSIANASSKWSWPTDFPAINSAFAGQRNKFIYTGTTSGTKRFLPHFPYDSGVKVNCFDGTVSFWCTGRRKFIGEPIFVPKLGAMEEDDGYILVVEYAVSKLRSNLVILDSKRIGRANALVVRLEVPKHLYFPLGFHGFWDTSSFMLSDKDNDEQIFVNTTKSYATTEDTNEFHKHSTFIRVVIQQQCKFFYPGGSLQTIYLDGVKIF